ncbi:MAG: hypothetical protein V4710_11245 [Verrucomicrobiota bacterium]
MLKKFLLLTLAVLFAVGGVACKKKPAAPLKAGELSVEEKAKLKRNAINAYEKIVKDYPESPRAETARKRLQELNPPGGK